MKIAVVTGCLGFFGVNLTKRLLNEGWKVYGVDKESYVSHKPIVHHNFTFKKAKIENLTFLPECDIVFNLAAESHVDNGNRDCKEFVDSNVHGVRNLLELLNSRILTSVDKPLFMQFSTDEVYGDREEGFFNEESPLDPSNPYAATKASADLLIKSWARTHGLDYIIVRPSNNYGEYQYPEKLIPIAVKRLMRGKKIKLHDGGTPIRTWTHIQDTIDAVMLLVDKGEPCNIYNISSEYEQTNLETTKKIISSYFLGTITRTVKSWMDHIDTNYKRPGQDVRYALHCNYLNQYGWQPKRTFDTEIVPLVKHFKQNFRW